MQKHINNNKDLLMVSLAKFYNNKNNINKIIPIINGTCDMSLRLIDWFVTNFSKKYSTIIRSEQNNVRKHLNVYLSYRSQLKAYSKQQFDPFRRRERITFYYNKDEYIETTIGQLNFFRWILDNNIIEFIILNRQDIENDMMCSQKENQFKKSCSENIKLKIIHTDDGESIIQKRKKRNELSKSFIKNMNKFQGSRTISFD